MRLENAFPKFEVSPLKSRGPRPTYLSAPEDFYFAPYKCTHYHQYYYSFDVFGDFAINLAANLTVNVSGTKHELENRETR